MALIEEPAAKLPVILSENISLFSAFLLSRFKRRDHGRRIRRAKYSASGH